MKLKIVNHYKYLGTFSTGLTFSYALKDMSDRARKGVLGILRLLWRLGEQCPKHCIDTASDSFGKTMCNMERKKLYEFRQRLIDCCLQDWYCAMALNDWYAFYSSFFLNPFSCRLLVYHKKKAVLKKHLVRFRQCVSPLKTHHL